MTGSGGQLSHTVWSFIINCTTQFLGDLIGNRTRTPEPLKGVWSLGKILGL